MGMQEDKTSFGWLMRGRGKKPVFLKYRSSKTFILFAMCWSVFTVSTLADVLTYLSSY